jgi:hypothetical protein
MNYRWILIRSWHRIEKIGLTADTLCGRHPELAGSVLVHDLPADGKSCESCLRILLRREEAGHGEDDASTQPIESVP